MKKIKAILNKNETILHTSKGSLNNMLPFLANSLFYAARSAHGNPTMSGKPKKVDRGLLEIYLCLTNQRLMIWKTTFFGRPKELYISMDLSNIKKVVLKTIRMYWKLPSVKIILKDDEKIGFWSAKVYKNKTIRLTKALKERISSN